MGKISYQDTQKNQKLDKYIYPHEQEENDREKFKNLRKNTGI
jgi:hypothetical protein